MRPVRATALYIARSFKAFALTGRQVTAPTTQGVALGYELLPLQGVLGTGVSLPLTINEELLPLQGVLGTGVSLKIACRRICKGQQLL